VFGGEGRSGLGQTAEQFDLTREGWVAMLTVPIKTLQPSCSEYEGKIYITSSGSAGEKIVTYDITSETYSLAMFRLSQNASTKLVCTYRTTLCFIQSDYESLVELREGSSVVYNPNVIVGKFGWV
jgi:hypothetical protein